MADKPIALLDASYAEHLVVQATNLGTLQPLEDLLTNYDVRVSEAAFDEIMRGNATTDASKLLVANLQNGTIKTEPNPILSE